MSIRAIWINMKEEPIFFFFFQEKEDRSTCACFSCCWCAVIIFTLNCHAFLISSTSVYGEFRWASSKLRNFLICDYHFINYKVYVFGVCIPNAWRCISKIASELLTLGNYCLINNASLNAANFITTLRKRYFASLYEYYSQIEGKNCIKSINIFRVFFWKLF